MDTNLTLQAAKCPRMAHILKFLFLFSIYFTTIQAELIEQSHIRLPSQKRDRHTRLHFYFHDILDSDHPTSVKIVNPPGSSPFGATYMVDVPLTAEPDLNSTLIGRAQGTYALASQQNDFAFKMDINFVFIEGIYKGSTLTMLGRNAILDAVREMPIVGGTGAFRFARGYALAKTIWYNSTSGNAIEEFNVTICHL